MNPPCSSMIFLVMERPRPVPRPASFVVKKARRSATACPHRSQTRVGHLQEDIAHVVEGFGPCCDLQGPAGGHCIVCVHDEIGERLLDLVLVDEDGGRSSSSATSTAMVCSLNTSVWMSTTSCTIFPTGCFSRWVRASGERKDIPQYSLQPVDLETMRSARSFSFSPVARLWSLRANPPMAVSGFRIS